jgi:endonuclease YncB( thermonuclease family)
LAKVRFQGEWKMWVGIAAIAAVLIGYLYLMSRPPMEGDEYLLQVTKVDVPATLFLKGAGKTMELRLAGLEIPSAMAGQAREFLAAALEGKWIRVKPLREDPKGVYYGFAYLSGEDIHARMIRQGLAKISREEGGYDVRPYIELEMEADKARRGLWALPGHGVK